MDRRTLLASFAVAPMAAWSPAQSGDAARATVREPEMFRVRVNRRGNWVIARLQTSAGVSGIGDASHGNQDQATVRFLQQFFALLKGRSVYDIEQLHQAVQPEVGKGNLSARVAFSALEQCLWDIHGKLTGLPVCDLPGGSLTARVRNYANINRSVEDRTPAGFARMAEVAVKDGFDAVKLAPFDDMPRDSAGPGVIERFTAAGKGQRPVRLRLAAQPVRVPAAIPVQRAHPAADEICERHRQHKARMELLRSTRVDRFSIHPDGKRLAFTLSEEATEIWAMENFLPGSSGGE